MRKNTFQTVSLMFSTHITVPLFSMAQKAHSSVVIFIQFSCDFSDSSVVTFYTVQLWFLVGGKRLGLTYGNVHVTRVARVVVSRLQHGCCNKTGSTRRT